MIRIQTISQVARLAGISTRTLQYYDEIGLLKPSGLTASGYRLYDDEALQKLQQILFFKELDFKLKDIRNILEKPDFDRTAVFKKQKELLLLKRNRTDRLIKLLDRLEKGEQCMSFKEFDLSDYIQALEDFKNNNTDSVMKYWGNIENFNLFIQKVKDDEDTVAKLAIKQFGSVEKYTEAMKYNLEYFSEIMEKRLSEVPKELVSKSDDLYRRLTSDREKDISSDEVQQIVHEIMMFMQENATPDLISPDYWNMITDIYYSNEYVRAVNDTKYGDGASDYIANAFRYYGEHNTLENN